MPRLRRSLSIAALVSALVPAVLTAGPAWAAPAQPQPIPGGIQIPGGPLIHVFGPGPKAIGGQGIDVEPSTITDFRGFSALAYLVGTATDGDGNTYSMSTDMRVFSGHYVGTDGAIHTGTFAFIWVDLFDPSSGSQVHDFNGGITASGLFWTLKIPRSDLVVSPDGKTATLTVVDQPVIDSFEFLGQNSVPATVSFSITWTATGTSRHLTPGSPDPTDPSNFAGDIYFRTVATGSFSGSEEGFRFQSDPGASSEGVFAEMGMERNGSFLS